MEHFIDYEDEMPYPQLSLKAWVLLRDQNMNESIGRGPRFLFNDLFFHEGNNPTGLDFYIRKSQVYLPNINVIEKQGNYYVTIQGDDIDQKERQYVSWLTENFPTCPNVLSDYAFFQQGRQYEEYPIAQFSAVFIGAIAKHRDDSSGVSVKIKQYFNIMCGLPTNMKPADLSKARKYLGLEE